MKNDLGPPVAGLALPAADEVDIWTAHLDELAPCLPALDALLPAHERAEGERLVRAESRRMFTLGRGLRRALLSAYLREAPTALRFTHGPHGKPAVLEPGPLHFNGSHSGEVVMIAVAARREVGIDVERLRDIPAGDDIMLRCSSPSERAAWKRLPSELRRAAFLCWWSRKEAVIKAIGRGLSFPLGAFDVEVDPDRSPCLLGSRDRTLDPAGWSMHPVESPRGYVATLTVQGPPVTQRVRKFSPCSLGVLR